MVSGSVLALHVGAAGSRDVVLLHGIPGSSRAWDQVVAKLPEDLRPIVPDLLGFGESARSTSPDELHAAGQARLLAAALQDVVRPGALLVGHDFGGPVAIHLLRTMAERFDALLIVASNLFGDTPIPFPLSLVTAPVIGPWLARLLFARPALAGMCRFGAKGGRVDVAASLGDRGQSAAIRTIFSHSLTHLSDLYDPIAQAVADTRLPAYVLWGDRDPFFPVSQAERTARAFPVGQYAIVERCGHFIPEEHPAAVAEQIRLIDHELSAGRLAGAVADR